MQMLLVYCGIMVCVQWIADLRTTCGKVHTHTAANHLNMCNMFVYVPLLRNRVDDSWSLLQIVITQAHSANKSGTGAVELYCTYCVHLSAD